MAKRDHSRIAALKKAWTDASLVDREDFVVWVGKESQTLVEEATKSLFSQHAEEHSADPGTSQGPGHPAQA